MKWLSVVLIAVFPFNVNAETLAAPNPPQGFCLVKCTPSEDDGFPDWIPSPSWLFPYCAAASVCEPIPTDPTLDPVTKSWRFPCAANDVAFGQCSKPIQVPVPMAPPPRVIDPMGGIAAVGPGLEAATGTPAARAYVHE